MNAYGPVSGNWCWIKADRADLRYALTHGWRMGIIITTIGLYAYLFFYFRQVFAIEQNLRTMSMKDEDAEHIMTVMANPQRFAGNPNLPQTRKSDDTHETERSSGDTGPFELPAISPRAEARQEQYKCQANSQALGELTGEFPMESTVNELEGDYPTEESDGDSPRKLFFN